jgi:diguanylate cyclase (GGDEF)-like protein
VPHPSRLHPALLHLYVGVVVAAGAGVVSVTLARANWPDWGGSGLQVAVLLSLGVAIGEWLTARIWRGDSFREYTFSGTFTVALVMSGPLWLPLLVQSLALVVDDVRHRRQPLKMAFNLGQYALAAAAARGVYALGTGQPFAGYGGDLVADHLLAALLAATVYFVVNVVLVSVVLAIATHSPVLSSLAGDIRNELSMTTMLLCVAPVVLVSLQFSLLMAPLCLLPIAAVHQAARAAAAGTEQARHDALTGLPNRHLLLQRLSGAVENARPDEHVGLLMLDLDHFKEVNDTLGHHVGDELLRLVAQRLSSVVRGGDTVARLGGDEFAVVCPDLPDLEAAVELAERFRRTLGEPFALEQISLHVEASVGVALSPLHTGDVDHLVQQADVALYQAKTDRATTRGYDPTHDPHSMERLALMEQLRSAMATQLVVHYQPKCRATDGALTGVEALVRWQHPVHGLLQPGRFLPAAENAGLIVPLTMHILRECLRQVREWRNDGLELSVAVNMSPRHLADVDLPNVLGTLLDEHGLPGAALVLEVTESSIMSDPARVAEVLRRIRSLGVAVSIDDFGTGYSSLAYLRDLHASEVKIDRTFVANASSNDRDLAIVKAAVDLGHALGLQVVAEGIEDVATARLMAHSGCDLLQGYLILPPVPAAEITQWSRRPHVWARGLPPTGAPELVAATT